MQFNVQQRGLRIITAGLLVACGLLAAWYWIGRYLTIADRAAQEGDWKQAREAVSIYLKYHPNDATACLLMAQSLIRDDKLKGDAKIYEALEHLNRISQTSTLAGEARLQEGRLHLLLLLQPGEAERKFLQSLEHDPHRFETHALLWRLYDLTARWDLAEEHFWHIYEQFPAGGRATSLRDWYLSEFSPGAANVELDRILGFVRRDSLPDSETDRNRLESFVAAEPQWAEGYVILARWFHRKGVTQKAQDLLKQAERLPDSAKLPSFIALRILISIDLGEFDQAKADFGRWPEPHHGYEYWKTAGLMADQVFHDAAAAVQAYNKAVSTTPGKSDWLTQHRLAQCLTRLGDVERAATVRQHSKQVELLMESPLHVRLRRALLTPRDPNTISQMVDLYRQLGRDREAVAWQQLLQRKE